jgi:hypothetical protein
MESLEEARAWPARTVLLLVLGSLGGLVFYQLIRGAQPSQWTDDPLRLGGAAFLAAGGIAFAVSLERRRWTWSVAFGLLVGLVVGGVTWRNGSSSFWGSNEAWQLFAALLAATIAVPLFQAARDAGRIRIDYRSLHAHALTNAILAGATGAFVLIVWLLANLLAGLFDLLAIHLLKDLLRKAWFDWTLAGAAFGAGLGLLRDRERVLVGLQGVATAIVSVLAPLFAFGLLFFVAALPFTGLGPLWNETKDTTPILLVCILGAFVLVNATIGASVDEEARAPVLRYSALALGAVMLPLGIVAAVSIGERVGQYGLTPDRLWAITAVAIALACGLLYFAAILRRRPGWAEDARRANIGLALGIGGLALLLALPIVSFGAISASNQLWRVRTGRVAPDKADWVAMRFDFGPAGVAALRRLQHGDRDGLGRIASKALAMKDRYGDAPAAPPPAVPVLRTIPAAVAVPPSLRDAIMPSAQGAEEVCGGAGDCLLYWKPGETTAIVLMDHCAERVVGREAQTRPGVDCGIIPHVMQFEKGGWHDIYGFHATMPGSPLPKAKEQVMFQRERTAIDHGHVTIREVKMRQVFVGDKPTGSPFE